MNYHFFSFKTLIILIGTILLFSCQQTEHDSLADFDALQLKLEEDQSYQAYIEASTEIYSATVDNKIDWVGIFDFMRDNGQTDICDCDTERLANIEGAKTYQQIHCKEVKPNFSEWYQNYARELNDLNGHQMKKLFMISPVVSSARASCLDALNVELAEIPIYCVDNFDDWEGVYGSAIDCIYNQTELAYFVYDLCICTNYDYC